MSASSESISLYVHIPYCVKRCGYCDFNTYTPSELKPGSDSVASVADGYINALLHELEISHARMGSREISTIFFGGGTPTLLPAQQLSRVIESARTRFGLARDCEITIEANPDSVNLSSLHQFREAGFNRISFGVQSVQPHVLQVLDRTHDSSRVAEVVGAARSAGFDSISIDLIYGTPGESIDDWEATIDFALSLPIDHVSAYALIVETGTKFGAAVGRGEILMPPDDETAEKYLLVDSKMRQAGFDWYELSNWAKFGHECRHNQSYWESNDWWGLGAGAHSHLLGERWWNVKHPQRYITSLLDGENPIAESEKLSPEEQSTERIMLKIRMREGLPISDFTKLQRATLEDFRRRELFLDKEWNEGRVVLSPQGRLLADQVVRALVS